MLSEEQYVALKEYIDARIKELIWESFGRDSLHESIATRDADKLLRDSLGLN